ncbi:transcriptional regulator [Candidatus Woesearchaeota archaeon]|nr:transcriptional regulator [Candidatus Woesearchaeota archaeon]
MTLCTYSEEKLSRAISAASRRQILRLLAENELTVNEIAAKNSMSKSLTSKHLTLLYDLGFLEANLQPPYKYYSLKDNRLKTLLEEYDKTISSLSSTGLAEIQEEKLSRAISAFSRRQILRLLAEKESTVTEVVSYTKMSKSLASRHLKLLYDLGFLSANVQPPFKRYSLKIPQMKTLLEEYDKIIGAT